MRGIFHIFRHLFVIYVNGRLDEPNIKAHIVPKLT